MVPMGFTMPFPEISGAEPYLIVSMSEKRWGGRNAINNKRGGKGKKGKALTMNRLINTITPALPIGNAAQTRRRTQANGARDGAGLVADDIAEQVARDEHAVQRGRVLDHDEGRAVDELVAQPQLRELRREHLGDDLAPQPARREHVRLVEADDGGGRVPRQRQAGREPRDALDLRPRVRLRVERVALAPPVAVFDPVPEVDPARQLPHDGEVRAAAHGRLQGRVVDERLRREEARPQVAVRLHLLAQLQEALLRAHGPRAPFRSADGAQEDGVGGLRGREGGVG